MFPQLVYLANIRARNKCRRNK